MTSNDRRAEQYAQLVRQHEELLTNRQGRARDLANIAMLPFQALNEGAVQAKASGEQYLVFWLNKREFAVRAELVQSVERLTHITPVPNVSPWIMGVMNLRGSIISVVDMKAFLDLEPTSIGTQSRLLALQYKDMVISFVVDGVNEMLAISPESIMHGKASLAAIPRWIMPYTSESISLNERVIVLLDTKRLLFSEKMQRV